MSRAKYSKFEELDMNELKIDLGVIEEYGEYSFEYLESVNEYVKKNKESSINDKFDTIKSISLTLKGVNS